MTLEQLFEMYLETIDSEYRDEYYADDRYIHSVGINGFLKWLKTQPYTIQVSDNHSSEPIEYQDRV